MANIGELTEIVISPFARLVVGADTYIMITDIVIDVTRPEDRAPTTDAGPVYTYGKGEHSFTATLHVTTPELSSLNTLNEPDANGAMTSTAWTIVYTNVSGATKTFAATGVLRDFHIRKPVDDAAKVDIDIFVRIVGDTITIS